MESPPPDGMVGGKHIHISSPVRSSSDGDVKRRVQYRGKSGSVLLSAPPPSTLPPAPKPPVKPALPARPTSPVASPRADEQAQALPLKPQLPAKPEAVVVSLPVKPQLPAKPAGYAPPIPGRPASPLTIAPPPPSMAAPANGPAVAEASAPAAVAPEERLHSNPTVPEKPQRPLVSPKPRLPLKPVLSDEEADHSAPERPRKQRSMSFASNVAAVFQAKMSPRPVEEEQEGPQEDDEACESDPASASDPSQSQNVGEDLAKKKKASFGSFIRTMSNPNFVKKEKSAGRPHPLAAQKTTPLSEEQLQATLPPMKKSKHLKSPESYFRPMLQYAVDMQFVSFDEVQDLYPGEKLVNRVVPQAKLGSKKFMKPFANVVETFLNIPNIYMQTWSEVFYARMVQFQNVLSPNHLEALRLVVDYYVQQLSVAERQSHLRARSLEVFTSFLQTHRYDPDSALIGLSPGRLYRSKYEKFLTSRDTHKQLSDADLSKKQLLDMIIDWSEGHDLERIGKKVKAFVHNMRHRAVTMLSEGDLVICQLPWAFVFGHEGENAAESDGEDAATKAGAIRRMNTLMSRKQIQVEDDNVIIARFAGREADGVLVFHTAQELTKVKVDAATVFPFSKSMLDLLGQAKAMQALVSDGADKLNSYLRDHLKTIVALFLEEHNISLDVLKRANNNEGTLLDLFTMRRYRDELDAIVAAPDELLNRVDSFSTQIIAKFTESMQHRDLFQPVRAQTLSELGSWPYCSLAKSRIKRWQGVVDSALMQLDIDRRLILNSTRKLQLSEWWLGLIRSSVKQLLMDNMYDFHAVNSNYIESPPDDMESIRQNLELIQEILSPAVDKHGVVEKLIKPLTERIYPKLDELVEMMYIVLMDQSFEHGQTSVESFNLSQYEGRLREMTGEPQGPPEEVAARLHSLLKDARYIHEMKAHEKNFRKQPEKEVPGLQRSKSFVMVDAVPVSGLIMNYFHRMEVELKTVIELWQDQDTIDNWHRQRGLPVPARISRPKRVVHNRLPPGARGSVLVEASDSEEAPVPVSASAPGPVLVDRAKLLKSPSAKLVVSKLDKKASIAGGHAGQLAKVREKAIALPRPPSLMRESDSEGEDEAQRRPEEGSVVLRIRPVTFAEPTARLSTHDMAKLSPRSVRANAYKLPLLESPRSKASMSTSPQEVFALGPGQDDPAFSSAGESKGSPRGPPDLEVPTPRLYGEAAEAYEEEASVGPPDLEVPTPRLLEETAAQEAHGSEEEQDPLDEDEGVSEGAPPPFKRVQTDSLVHVQPMCDDDDMIISDF